MTYSKPEVAVLGTAYTIILGKDDDFGDNPGLSTASCDLDEE